MWLFTTAEHIDSLMKEFPDLSRRQVWRSGKNCWVVLAARLECFEEYAFKACELILNGDPRIGRLSRRYRTATLRELVIEYRPSHDPSGPKCAKTSDATAACRLAFRRLINLFAALADICESVPAARFALIAGGTPAVP